MRTLLLALLFISSNIYAARIVLLSSLDTPKIWYHSKDWEIEESLEKIFDKRLKNTKAEIIKIEKASAIDLWTELHNPDNLAVFWLSHAKDETSVATGIASEAAIVDYYGVDVKEVIQTIHPNIFYFGLIGCNAESIIKKNSEAGMYSDNPNLKIHSFNKKIDARKGLRKSIDTMADHLGKLEKKFLKSPKVILSNSTLDKFKNNQICEKKFPAHKITVQRKAETTDLPAVAIKVQDYIVEYLPAQKANTNSEFDIYLSKDIKSINDLKITVDSNQFNTSTKIDLGEFEFFSDSIEGNWKVFSKPDGSVIGTTKNLFKYKGSIPLDDNRIEFQKYKCL